MRNDIPVGFKGAARRLGATDLSKFAKDIGVEEAVLRAVLEVEGKGESYDDQGRPIMLFEPHIFWRELGAGPQRDAAVKAGLARKAWKRDYPKDSYPRLVRAMAINDEAALRSASWGLGQVMGFNNKVAGFSSAGAMVAAMCEDERHQLTAMLGFIHSHGLVDEMQRKDWAGFARRYNGAEYAKNDYDGKLARAYAKWVRQLAKKPAPGFVDRARVQAVQNRLRELGYAMVGRADGKPGPRTAAAIAAFQKENDLPITGEITDELIGQLETASPHQPSPERADGKPEDSRILDVSGAIKKGAVVAGTIAGGDQAIETLEKVEAATGYADRVVSLWKPLRELVADHWPIIVIGAAIYLAWLAHKAAKAGIEDYRTGRHNG